MTKFIHSHPSVAAGRHGDQATSEGRGTLVFGGAIRRRWFDFLQGLKPTNAGSFMARLKPCPDTELRMTKHYFHPHSSQRRFEWGTVP